MDSLLRSRWQLLLLLFAVVIVFTVIKAEQGISPPALTTNCLHPAVAVAPVSAGRGDVVAWSATGPAGDTVVLAIGAGVRGTTGTLQTVPAAGVPADRSVVLSDATPLSGCRAHGLFTPRVPAGYYRVTMFAVGAQAGPTGRALASTPLRVTG